MVRVSDIMFDSGGVAKKFGRRQRSFGLVLAELLVVVLILGLFVMMTRPQLFGVLLRSTFKAQVNEFVSTMQKAARAAAESDKKYEVIVNLDEQSYLLREITTSDLAQVLEEEIIAQGSFGENVRIEYVLFDDFGFGDNSYTNQGLAKFRAGHVGWAYGGVIVLSDEAGEFYSVVVNRANRLVKLQEGEITPLKPKAEYELSY